MKLRTLLDLARISNLPTVWSNVLAGAVLASESPEARPIVVAGVAGSLLYSGGMFLNDAFDAEIDARERPERPSPSGRIRRKTVLALGLAMLAVALAVLAAFALARGEVRASNLVGTGLAVAVAVVIYDRWHKGVAWSPVVMGFCRAGLYVLGAFAVASRVELSVAIPALSLLLYVVGLTHVARFENASAVGRVWPTLFLLAPAFVVGITADFTTEASDPIVILGVVLALHVGWTLRALRMALRGGRGAIPRSVVALIAGISLVDATFVAATRGTGYGFVAMALAAFGLTLFLQRWVRGT
jgi:4-hydroxybenzoate polyprenyltransferase